MWFVNETYGLLILLLINVVRRWGQCPFRSLHRSSGQNLGSPSNLLVRLHIDRMLFYERFKYRKIVKRMKRDLEKQAVHLEVNYLFKWLCDAYDNGRVCEANFMHWKRIIMHAAEKKKC